MANQTINYGTTAAVGVGTALNSLANGSAAQTDAVLNGTTKAVDYEVEVVTNALAGNTGAIDVWVAASLDAGTSYADGATGTAGAFTAANRKNARWLGSVNLNGATAVRATLAQSVAQAFGGVVPERFALILTNNSGAALAASGHAINVRPITYDVV